MGAKKYLRESYCHCIECSVTNFLVVFMWKRPLNSATMATPTHREPERMSNATKTQIVAWMINKWRAKIIGRELYNRRDSPWRGDKKF